jgi:8-oxo-dGTP diphosphatase
MEERHGADLTSARKRRFSRWLREVGALRLGLRAAARLTAPRQPVGAVGAVIDHGRVLLVEHVFRTDFPWGLPGGWVRPGESPAETVRRELREELGIDVEVGALLLGEPIGLTVGSTHPRHLGLAYACRLVGGTCRPTFEVASFEWVRPDEIRRELAPFQTKAVIAASALMGGGVGDAAPTEGS